MLSRGALKILGETLISRPGADLFLPQDTFADDLALSSALHQLGVELVDTAEPSGSERFLAAGLYERTVTAQEEGPSLKIAVSDVLS